jgi:putative methanogenesis marker 13 metalloprotein
MILHPRPSPIAAAMYQLRDVGVDAIILHGPAGCCFRTARLLELDGVRVFTSAMDENDFIFGAMDKLRGVVEEVIEYLKKNKNNFMIGIVGTCASMIIGEDIWSVVDEYNATLIPVEVHSGLNDNTAGAINAMESCLKLGLIDEKEFERQKYMLKKATEIEKKRGMAKSKYIKPTYEDDLKDVVELFKNNIDKNPKVACVLNAKKETAYLFAHPLIKINEIFNNCINIGNLDENVGLKKIREDAKNILRVFKVDYITGGLDEYPITGEKAVEILREIKPDIVVVSGVPHALPIEELKEEVDCTTIGVSDGPRLYYPIKEYYDYAIIELDAHAKVLGKREVVKSRFGEILEYAFGK